MIKSLGIFARRVVDRILGGPRGQAVVDRLYEEKDYLDAYSRHTDIRVQSDPHAAVGGLWEEIGKLQFDFLCGKGLQPSHNMLDLGCGTLRGGRHFIRYLEPGHYTGLDISQKAIQFGNDLVRQEGLSAKQPRLVLSKRKDLRFLEFAGETFDFILAQSVFTHLKPEHISECFQHVSRIMNKDSVFYFTYFLADSHKQTSQKDFRYPFSFFQSLAEENSFDLKDCSDEYPHPRDQKMAEMRKL